MCRNSWTRVASLSGIPPWAQATLTALPPLSAMDTHLIRGELSPSMMEETQVLHAETLLSWAFCCSEDWWSIGHVWPGRGFSIMALRNLSLYACL